MSTNKLNLTKADYAGRPSTLCKGCGHDSITNAIIQAYFELGVNPTQVIKLSGIGCSSKTPTYFMEKGHGFNSVHGRMPSVATGANVANYRLPAIGVSGDGDTGSIGIGQYLHVARRNVDMVYIIENNGTYGLTKGQFSATADLGSPAKRGTPNPFPCIDCCAVAIDAGATFVARSFSGDRKQLISLIKAAYSHRGLAVIDVISPCVTFNNHEGSTKSYDWVKEHDLPLQELQYVPEKEEIEIDMKEGDVRTIELHDGSHLTLRKLGKEHDPSDRASALKLIHDGVQTKELVTGLLYFNPEMPDHNTILNLSPTPLTQLGEKDLNPGPEVIKKLNASMK
ncbi:MAG: 2-oxoacid:ferredoxin oxidoreductase subunit beta [Bdellovibrionales bacterium]|nr:2-oxoacid:ferredoxin oxidoreductase subunit beta [Bdellovibrionales bacterium]